MLLSVGKGMGLLPHISQVGLEGIWVWVLYVYVCDKYMTLWC